MTSAACDARVADALEKACLYCDTIEGLGAGLIFLGVIWIIFN